MAWECAKINCRISAVHVAGSINIMADTVSHLHEGKINEFVQLLSYYHRGRQPVIEWNQHMYKSALFFLSVQMQQHPAESGVGQRSITVKYIQRLLACEMRIFRLLPEFRLFDGPRGHSRDPSKFAEKSCMSVCTLSKIDQRKS